MLTLTPANAPNALHGLQCGFEHVAVTSVCGWDDHAEQNATTVDSKVTLASRRVEPSQPSLLDWSGLSQFAARRRVR